MAPDEHFVQLVRDALRHLYDYPYLQKHPLAEQLLPEGGGTPRERVRALRATLFEAIAELKPGPGVPFGSDTARTHSLLNLRYVEGSSIQEVGQQLSLSERQLHRHLRKAERDLAAILWAQRPHKEHPQPSQEAEPEPAQHGLLYDETRRLGMAEPVDLQDLLEGSLAAVSRLCRRCGVSLDARLPENLPIVDADRVLLRQAVVSALSYALQSARPASVVTLLVSVQQGDLRLLISFQQGDGHISDVAAQLAHSLGGEWSVDTLPDGRVDITLELRSQPPVTLLVIDDNQGLAELFRRYLAGEGYQVLEAHSGVEGLELAGAQQPDLIVLDVLMPHTDGFEVLQWLQTREGTRHIPVIICSVLNDPELAYSLGAAAFLAKPVSADQLLAVLARCWPDTRSRPRRAAPANT